MTGNRTLSHKGEKETLAVVNNKNATTHSFTLQITINRMGYLCKQAYLVLREVGGKFGPNVIKEIEELRNTYTNVVVVPSASGKMERKHVENWYKTCLKPELTGM